MTSPLAQALGVEDAGSPLAEALGVAPKAKPRPLPADAPWIGPGERRFYGPQEKPLEAVSHPLEPIMWMPGARVAAGLKGAAIGGATAVGGSGAAEDILGGRNPLPDLPFNLAMGGAMGPAANIAARGVRRLFPKPKAKAPVVETPVVQAAPKPADTIADDLTRKFRDAYPKENIQFTITKDVPDSPGIGMKMPAHIVVKEEGGDFFPDWVFVPEHMRGSGIGSELYIKAADEAAKRGGRLVISDDVSDAAMATWKRLVRDGVAKEESPGKFVIDRRFAVPTAHPIAAPPAPLKPEPFRGASPDQQQPPGAAPLHEEITKDPGFLKRLKDLGGGRVHPNAQTLDEAIRAGGPMHPDEIAGWGAETPVNAVTQTRALLTNHGAWEAWKKAVVSGDVETSRKAADLLKHIEPGIQNMRATPGRALQAQAMFVRDRVQVEMEKIADMQRRRVPFDQIRAEVGRVTKEMEKGLKLVRTENRVLEAVRALETYATAAKLTSPVTHAINTVSNAMTFALIRPAEKMVKAGVQVMQGQPAEARASVEAVFGTTLGWRSGLQKYLKTLMDDNPEMMGASAEATQRGLPFPRKLRPLDPFRQLSAADALWKSVLRDSELNQKAMASALKEGLKGPALHKRVTELVNDPPVAWVDAAEAHAKEFTFQEDPDRFLSGVMALRNIPGMRLIIPFIQTPYNLAKFQAQRSALGVVSPRNIHGFAAGGEARAEAVARQATGLVFAGGALALVRSGDVTGPYPKEQGERALWDAEGRRPWSVRVGGRWLQYSRFQPVGTYLAQVAALQQAIDSGDEKSAGALGAKVLGATVKQMADQPFVSGMSSLIDVLTDYERNAPRFVGKTLAGLIPNLARDIRYQTDPTMRETKGIMAPSQNMIPGLSQRLPAQVDVLGKEIKLDLNRLARASKVYVAGREGEETRAMRESGFRTTSPKPTLRIQGADVKLSGKDQERFEKEMGAEVAKAIRTVRAQPGWSLGTKDERADRIDDAVNKARRMIRERWKKTNPQPRAAKEE